MIRDGMVQSQCGCIWMVADAYGSPEHWRVMGELVRRRCGDINHLNATGSRQSTSHPDYFWFDSHTLTKLDALALELEERFA